MSFTGRLSSTNLPNYQGIAVEVLLSDDGKLTDEDVAELDVAIEESASQFSRGEFEDAHALASRLVAKL